jgi:hypothetical protein
MTSTDDQRARLSAMRRELVEILAQDGPSPAGRAAVAGIDDALEVLEEMPPAEKMPSPGMLRRWLWQVREDALFGSACYASSPPGSLWPQTPTPR